MVSLVSIVFFCSGAFRWPQPPVLSQGTAVQMGGVLPYKWEVYCWVSLSLSSRLRSQMQVGTPCSTNWRCTEALSPRTAFGIYPGKSSRTPAKLSKRVSFGCGGVRFSLPCVHPTPCVRPRLNQGRPTHRQPQFSNKFASNVESNLIAPKSQRLLLLRYPSRTPEIASDFRDKTKPCCIAI